MFYAIVDDGIGDSSYKVAVIIRAAGIITVPDEKEIIAAMEEIRNNPSNVA
ncbi:MAG: hypothetical protein IJR90_07670 [Clostridia bacterium]|nr:hypothetical protein [Clostridia bacterium]